MKKLAHVLLIAIAFSFTTQAQQQRKEKKPQLSVEQHTDLALKRLTLALDLTEKQQSQIQPLIKAQTTKKMAMMEKRKEMRKNNTKPTADEVYKMQAERLDDQIAMKNRMKTILNDSQFEKLEKMEKDRKMKGRDAMKRKVAMKKRMQEENKGDD